MKIDELRLQNFRCFENETFSFSPQINILHGSNGSGKTSILDAIAAILSRMIEYLSVQDSNQVSFSYEDIRAIYEDNLTLAREFPSSIKLCFQIGELPLGITESIKDGLSKQELDFEWPDIPEIPVRSAYLHPIQRENDDGTIPLAMHQILLKLKENKTNGLPVIAYYRAGRSVARQDRSESTWHKRGVRERGYQLALNSIQQIMPFLDWMKTYEAVSLQERKPVPLLESVKQAISNNMENWKDTYYKFSDDDLYVTSETGETLPLRMLSDGQRSMLMMVADIARRAAILNPEFGDELLSKTSGIVLIDEIDMHLHPAWQRKVLDTLRTTFPNIQFIITTHSPFIIQSARPGELIDLNGDGETALYYDQSIEDITENVMGVELPQHSERYKQMFSAAEEYYRVLEQTDTATDDEIAQLKTQLDVLLEPFSDDPAYQAFLKMERLAKLGSNGHAASR